MNRAKEKGYETTVKDGFCDEVGHPITEFFCLVYEVTLFCPYIVNLWSILLYLAIYSEFVKHFPLLKYIYCCDVDSKSISADSGKDNAGEDSAGQDSAGHQTMQTVQEHDSADHQTMQFSFDKDKHIEVNELFIYQFYIFLLYFHVPSLIYSCCQGK